MASWVVGQSYGPYRIVALVGEGGMGRVYEAVESPLGRTVALKVLASQFAEDRSFRGRFGREATMLASLNSPHVIQVYWFGELDGELCLVTQFVRGNSLQQYLARKGPLAPDVALLLVSQIAGALCDAHAVGLVHRDVKPGNVLLHGSGEDIFGYLCDFGIARSTSPEATVTVGVTGTYGFMAPELHQGERASVASDVYSLGCLLWSALSGKPPYGGDGVQLALAHIHAPIPQFPEESAVAAQVNRILQRSMAKDPTDRYASATEMRHDLRNALRLAEADGSGAQESRSGFADAGAVVPTPTGPATEVTKPSDKTRSASQTWTTPAPGRIGEEAPRKSRVKRSVTAVAVLAALAATVAVGAAIADHGSSGEGGSPSAAGGGAASGDETVTPSSEGESDTNGAPTSTASGTPVPQSTGQVPCWRGVADKVEGCPVPRGRQGLASVFPSLDAACRWRPDSTRGKAEAFLCKYGDYQIRYSRWMSGLPDSSRIRHYREQAPVLESMWVMNGVSYGLAWPSYEAPSVDPFETHRWQWSATYFDHPYSVSVEATSRDARRRAILHLEAKPPTQVGLR